MVEYFSHPLIKEKSVEKRIYQLNIVKTCLKGNTLIILPTGLGKTVIATLLVAEKLKENPEGKCFILAPTKPLILQHYETFKSILNFNKEDFVLFTGEISPSKRSFTSGKIMFLTPQVLENDLITGRVKLEDVVLMVFDEAHRAVGNYPYVLIAEIYRRQAKNPLIVGLTASPGSTKEKIEEVKRNLGIRFVEVRTEESFDVKPYIQPVKVEWVNVELDEIFKKIKLNLESYIQEKLETIHKLGFLEKVERRITFKKFSEIKSRIAISLSEQPTIEAKKAMLNLMCVRHATHAVELLETQGLTSLKEYFRRLEAKAGRPGISSVKEFLLDGRIQEVLNLTFVYESQGFEHPKIGKLLEVVEKSFLMGARRIIVFTNYRETSKKIVEKLNKISGVKAVRLVGQTSKFEDVGLSQKEQAEILASFKDGKFNVLVATQVAEEGIDVETSDVVVFYDNVPSAVRFIQRRGRTGRKNPGKIIILMAKGTKDHVYYRLARWKEKMMMETVKKIQVESQLGSHQQNLEKFFVRLGGENVKSLKVIVDNREVGSPVVKELVRLGVNIEVKSLPVGDYIISEDVVVERKTVSDFASSLIDKRIFVQAKNLALTYPKPVFVVEGENLYWVSGISAKAIRGTILSLILDYKIPTILTKNPGETAAFIVQMAEKEQLEKISHPTIRGEKKPLTLKEQQEYVVAGLPNVELTLAKRLLEVFGSVEKVFQASKDELKKVPGIGETIAEKIRKVITSKYSKEE